MNNYIGIFDSGIGGFTILEKLREILPNENFLYYADRCNVPYGNKNDDELLRITSSIVEGFKKYNCKMIVIACNTATTRCMKKLKEKYRDILFVGVVPAIKVACDNNFKNTLVMATPATIESERTLQLVKENKKQNQNIYLAACEGLAIAIEKGDFKTINKILDNIAKKYQDKEIDAIVLGCTHYPLIKEEILSKMPNSKLIDGSLGVANEVKRLLEENNLLNTGPGCVHFLEKIV